MSKCAECEKKFIGWGWVIFDKNTQDSTGFHYCSEECGNMAIDNLIIEREGASK